MAPTPLQKIWEIAPRITPEIDQELQKYPPVLRQLLFNRNINNQEAADVYLGTASQGHDPFWLTGMRETVEKLFGAIDHGKKMNETGPLLQGVEIILRQFLTFLESFGVKPVAALGEPFDPEKHEAVSQAESDQEPDRVISEMEKGYLFHGRLLRPAKVLVSKVRPEKKAETKESK